MKVAAENKLSGSVPICFPVGLGQHLFIPLSPGQPWRWGRCWRREDAQRENVEKSQATSRCTGRSMHFDPWEIKHPWSFLVASVFVFCMIWVYRLCLCVCVLVHVSVANAICSPGVAITQSDPEHHKIIHCSISKRLYTVLLCLCVSIYMCVCVCVCLFSYVCVSVFQVVW